MKSGRKLPKRCKGHIKNCKRRGEWSELQFMARASKNGLRLANPWGDSSRYDVLVETGGHFVRVQVKSTANSQPNGGYVCGVHPMPEQRTLQAGRLSDPRLLGDYRTLRESRVDLRCLASPIGLNLKLNTV
jgi:hypothetical protein